MSQKAGRCRNYGNCGMADTGKMVYADDTNFVCTECGKDLKGEPGKSASPDKDDRGGGKGWLMVVGAVLLVIGLAGFLFFYNSRPEQQPEPVSQGDRPTDQASTPATRAAENPWAHKPAEEWIQYFKIDRR